jgi:GTP-binding protein HflX
VCPVSALTGEGVAALSRRIAGLLDAPRHDHRLTLPFSAGRRRAWLHAEGVVEEEVTGEEGWTLSLRWTDRQAHRFRTLAPG